MLVTSGFIFFITLIVTCYSLRKIIYISHKKHLFDEPTENRKIHLKRTPNLGGIAIFASMMFTSCFFLPFANISHLNYIVASASIMFIVGLTDDLVGMNPTKKMLAQIIVSLMVTIFAGLRFTSFYGFFGFYEMPYVVSIAVSTLFILLMINSFNLIDGINCLAGSIGLLACITFAYLFWEMRETGYFFLSVAMCGCLAGFLYYNRTPAKIFMGDTGSLFLGFMIAAFAIHFIELNKTGFGKQATDLFKSAPAIMFGLLIIPIFDTLRVFALRILNKKPPFGADRNHIHHRLIDLNLSHVQSTGILLLFNLICLFFAVVFRNLRMDILFICVSAFAIFSNWILGLITLNKAKPLTNPEDSYNPINSINTRISSIKFFTGNIQKTSSPKEESVNKLS